ncbi:peptidoglycan editing factor PgeF [uncultured Bacteroides sp.]|uniref:peptidoglycan editing factor PgeF n=1 Tax=uncultured Bacteroides sp. TaxID=162156 RepID=UPI0026366EB0|nr:peptidoglycan editing factor PgeF [uncultured Bacteroides sp.]
MIFLTEDRKMLGYEVLASYSNISCFVTTRHGGCSRGNYASLNCTPYTGDDPESVRRNQEIIGSSLPQQPKELIIPFQTHGTQALIIDETYLQATAEERRALLQGIDALITHEPGCCICVSTADCVPILLYDRKNTAIAAVHAGWRGTVNHILSQTLERMHTCYGTEGKDVIACIGPSISLAAFEVGDEVYETFQANGFQMEYISEWKPETHKYHIDLWAANRLQLLDFGVPDAQVQTANICTFAQHEEFFSARRLGIQSGRILSGIMLQ